MSDPTRLPFAKRWWTYQAERFPLVGHGPLIAAFSFCAVSFSHQLRQAPGFPAWPSILVALVTCFTFFLQLRIADEFKDFEDDLKYRPYRPVQRGLVTLRELGILFAIGALLQLILALLLQPRLIVLLAITWTYLAAMSKEFFVGDWLKRRPLLYMVSHMMIMPLIDLYATSTEWLPAGEHRPPLGIGWFLVASFFNGMVIEIGRKIRSPADEEHGVSTYSAEWGLKTAVVSWGFVIIATGLCAIMAARRVDVAIWVGAILATMAIIAALLGITQIAKPEKGRGKRIEVFAGLWTIALYLSLGLLPLLKGRLP